MTAQAAAQALALKRVRRAMGQVRAAAAALKAAADDEVDLVGEARVTDASSLEQALNIVRHAYHTHRVIDLVVIRPPDDGDPTTALQGQDRKAHNGERNTRPAGVAAHGPERRQPVQPAGR